LTFTNLSSCPGATARSPGPGLGCGEHWPLCNGKLLPPLDLPTRIEYGHRLAAAAVSGLVTALAAYAWCLRRDAEYEMRDAEAPDATRAAHPPSRIPHPDRPGVAAYVGLMLLVLQVGLGAVTVKLSL